jgi:hypothetical protein
MDNKFTVHELIVSLLPNSERKKSQVKKKKVGIVRNACLFCEQVSKFYTLKVLLLKTDESYYYLEGYFMLIINSF